MGKKGIIIRIMITLLFLVSLYFVEAGFCGSNIVAKYNDGFGTVDMKCYDTNTVKKALAPMEDKGIEICKLYYIMDYIFIIFFGIFQIMIINDIYSFNRNVYLKYIINTVPILRGICDIIENSILLRTLYTYPRINELSIALSVKFTEIKFICIKVWILFVIVGLVWKTVLYFRRNED